MIRAMLLIGAKVDGFNINSVANNIGFKAQLSQKKRQ